MGKQRKHFDKKNAQRFRLVPGGFSELNGNDASSLAPMDDDTKKAEQLKYGIFFEDDYDYLQHLKSSTQTTCLELISYKIGAINQEPSAISRSADLGGESLSEIEPTNHGDLSEVDRQLEMDTVDNEDGDDELEDDFIVQANCGKLPSLEEHGLVRSTVISYPTRSKGHTEIEDLDDYNDDLDSASAEESDEDSIGDDMEHYFAEKGIAREAPSKNEQRSMLDERLAKVLESYDDDDIGALDDKEICGGSLQPTDDLFKQAEEDFEKKRKVNKKSNVILKEPPTKPFPLAARDDNLDDSEEASSLDEEESNSEDDVEKIRVAIKPKESRVYNCESILSITSSCIPSHLPNIIVEKSNGKSRKNSVSSSAQPPKPKALKTLKECSESDSVEDKTSLVRKRGETAEERKIRKAEIRERKKERREQKKSLKDVFEREKCAVERQLASTFSAVRLA